MNQLFLVAGPSGSGKNTSMKHVVDNEIITMTTRPMRDGEVDGKDYFFITKKQFEQAIDNCEMVEYTKYINGHYYGITKSKLENQIKINDSFVIVDLNGVRKYKEFFPEAKSIYIYVSYEDMEKQLYDRGGDMSDIENRLKYYKEQIAERFEYDYIIENKYGKLEETIKKIKSIIK